MLGAVHGASYKFLWEKQMWITEINILWIDVFDLANRSTQDPEMSIYTSVSVSEFVGR